MQVRRITLYGSIKTIQKQDTVMRPAISSRTKLGVTLRYLATGDSFRLLGLMFRVPHNTNPSFSPDDLAAIYDSLSPFIKVCVYECKIRYRMLELLLMFSVSQTKRFYKHKI